MPQPLPNPFLEATRGLDEGPQGPAGPSGAAGSAGPSGPQGSAGVALPFNVVPTGEYISHGQTVDTFPTTGLVRLGASIGAGGATAPIVVWRRDQLAGDISLISVRDSSASFAEVIYGGPTGDSSQTKVTGNRVFLEANTVRSRGALSSGNHGPGGTCLEYNWSLSAPYNFVPSFGGGFGLGFIGANSNLPSSGSPGSGGAWIYVYTGYLTFHMNLHDKYGQVGTSSTRPDILSRLTREVGHFGGVASRRYLSRGGWASSHTVYEEKETSASGIVGWLLRYWMPDECSANLKWTVQMVRKTAATKAGTFRGSASLRRTGGGMPVHMGTSPHYEADDDTSAGEGVDIFIHPVSFDPQPGFGFGIIYEIQIRPICADVDNRRWFIKCEVEEVHST